MSSTKGVGAQAKAACARCRQPRESCSAAQVCGPGRKKSRASGLGEGGWVLSALAMAARVWRDEVLEVEILQLLLVRFCQLDPSLLHQVIEERAEHVSFEIDRGRRDRPLFRVDGLMALGNLVVINVSSS